MKIRKLSVAAAATRRAVRGRAIRRPLALTFVAALAAASTVACGNTNSATSPRAVQSALDATSHQSGLRLTVSLEGDMSALSGRGRSGLTPAQEQAISDSRLTLTVHAARGTSLSNAGGGGDLVLSLAEGGNTLGEVRVVGSTLFARVDIPRLTTTYGLDKGRVAQVRSELERLGSQVGGLSALDHGQWVSIDINLVNEFAQTAGITLPSTPQLAGRIVGALFASLAQSTNIKSTGRNQAQMTVNTPQMVTALTQAAAATPGMSSLDKQIKGLAQRAQRAHAAVPASESPTVVATLSGGMVSNISLSLNQLQKLSGPASINLAVAKSGPVSAPSGATAINLPQLLHAMEGTSATP